MEQDESDTGEMAGTRTGTRTGYPDLRLEKATLSEATARTRLLITVLVSGPREGNTWTLGSSYPLVSLEPLKSILEKVGSPTRYLFFPYQYFLNQCSGNRIASSLRDQRIDNGKDGNVSSRRGPEIASSEGNGNVSDLEK